ncbi:MAG: glycoside hydrolase family protein [Paludibacter sp.]|nr:glycoside hydrolase family protein [Paludibacter sp.]
MKLAVILVFLIFKVSCLCAQPSKSVGKAKFQDNVENIAAELEASPSLVSGFCESLVPLNRILELKGWHVWGTSPIIDDTGKVHVFFSRWRGGFDDWLIQSEIAHAVAEKPEGPYKVIGTVLKGRGGSFWDANTIHNPTIHKVGDKYALFYIGNNLSVSTRKNAHHASTQRIGLAVSDNLYGPWQRISDQSPILDVNIDTTKWDSYLTTNPAFLRHANGQYWLYYKSWDRYNDGLRKMGLAIAEQLEGPYIPIKENPIVSFSAIKKQVEDAYVFFYRNKYYMLMRDMGVIHPHVGIMMESEDGINWSGPTLGYRNSAFYFGGGIERFERPQVLIQHGRPTHLFLALKGGKFKTSSPVVLEIDSTKF